MISMNSRVCLILAIAFIGKISVAVATKSEACQKLVEAVDIIGAEDQNNVIEFVGEVLKHNQSPVTMVEFERPIFNPSFNGLTRGSLDFLKMKDPQLSKENSEADLYEIFADTIVKSCKMVIKRIQNPLELCRRMLYTDEQVDEQVDELTEAARERFVTDWTTRLEVCKEIVRDKYYILYTAHEILLGNRNDNEILRDPRRKTE